MKGLSLVLSLFASTASFATPAPRTCTSGQLGEDNYVQVQILADSIAFDLHETSFSIPLSKVEDRGQVLVIPSQDVNVTAEGTEATVKVEGAVSLPKVAKKVLLDLTMDGTVMYDMQTLDCQ